MITKTSEKIPFYFAIISVFLLAFYIQGNSFFTLLFGLSTLVIFYKEIKFSSFLNLKTLVPILLYLVLFISAYYSTDQANGLNSLGKKSFIISIPIIFALLQNHKEKWIKTLLSTFVFSTFLAVLSSFIYSIFKIINGAEINTLTHSNFTEIIGLQSTYLALYMLVAVYFLYFSFRYEILSQKYFSKKIKLFLILFFISFIILIGTRILYIPLAIFLVYIIIKQMKTKFHLVTFLLISIISFSSIYVAVNKIPLLQNRISEFKGTDFSVLKLDKFEYDTPINGLTMRLLFAKFGLEVLEENNTLLFGEGLGDAQDMIHCKFVEYNFYMGNPLTNDTGYLGYNYHNQYIQILVQSGLLGLLVFVFIFLFAFNKNNPLLNFILLTYLVLFLVESAIERQNGISHIFFFTYLLSSINLKRIKNYL